MTQNLMDQFVALESKQGHDSKDQAMEEGSAAVERVPGARKRRMAEATRMQETAEGVSASHNFYSEPCTSAHWDSDTPGKSAHSYGECTTMHNTQCTSTAWPWAGGMQQPHVTPNHCGTPPMGWSSCFWPPVSTHCCGWGTSY